MAAFLPRRDAIHAALAKCPRRISQQMNRLQQACGEQRHRDIEFKKSTRPAPCDGGLVSSDSRGHHGHRLGHHRIHLSRHDRRARLGGGQQDFTNPAPRTGCQQADITGDLVQGNGDGGELPVRFHTCVLRGLCFEVILSLAKRNAGLKRDADDGFSSKIRMRVQSRSHRRPSER